MNINNYIVSDLTQDLFYFILLTWGNSDKLRELPKPVAFGSFDISVPISYVWKLDNLEKLLNDKDVVDILVELKAIEPVNKGNEDDNIYK